MNEVILTSRWLVIFTAAAFPVIFNNFHIVCLNQQLHNFQLVRVIVNVLWHCWVGGRKGIWPVKKTLSGGVLAWLSVWSEVQTYIWTNWCHCHSLSLASVKSRLVLPFCWCYWYVWIVLHSMWTAHQIFLLGWSIVIISTPLLSTSTPAMKATPWCCEAAMDVTRKPFDCLMRFTLLLLLCSPSFLW